MDAHERGPRNGHTWARSYKWTHMSEVLQMLSSKFYRTNRQTDKQTNRQTRSIVESGPPTKNKITVNTVMYIQLPGLWDFFVYITARWLQQTKKTWKYCKICPLDRTIPEGQLLYHTNKLLQLFTLADWLEDLSGLCKIFRELQVPVALWVAEPQPYACYARLPMPSKFCPTTNLFVSSNRSVSVCRFIQNTIVCIIFSIYNNFNQFAHIKNFNEF